jgi:hypothetical protein
MAAIAFGGVDVVHEVIAHQRRIFAGVVVHALRHVGAVQPRQVGLAGEGGLAPHAEQVIVDRLCFHITRRRAGERQGKSQEKRRYRMPPR